MEGTGAPQCGNVISISGHEGRTELFELEMVGEMVVRGYEYIPPTTRGVITMVVTPSPTPQREVEELRKCQRNGELKEANIINL